jgi:hypothetical protein
MADYRICDKTIALTIIESFHRFHDCVDACNRQAKDTITYDLSNKRGTVYIFNDNSVALFSLESGMEVFNPLTSDVPEKVLEKIAKLTGSL